MSTKSLLSPRWNTFIDSRAQIKLCSSSLGNCTNTSTTEFSCQCGQGYVGLQCEAEMNLCKDGLCENRGVCSPKFLNYTCHCLQGYSGSRCETSDSSHMVRVYVSRSKVVRSIFSELKRTSLCFAAGFAYIAILMISLLFGFVFLMDVLKYVFHIDPVESERELSRQKQRRMRKKPRTNKPPDIVRYRYVSWADRQDNGLELKKSHHFILKLHSMRFFNQ